MFVSEAGALHQCLLVFQERLKAVNVSEEQGVIRSKILDDGRVLVYEYSKFSTSSLRVREYKVYMQVLHQNILSTLLVREYEVYMQLFH